MYNKIIKTTFFNTSSNLFILDKLYLINKFNYSLRIPNNILGIDGFNGFTIIYLVYLSYLQKFTTIKQVIEFYKYCPLTAKLYQNINLLEFIYLTAFNKLLGNQLKSYDLILFLEKRIKCNIDFKLYKIFYKNYFNFVIPKYNKLDTTADIINRAKELLGNEFYTLSMYKSLNSNDKAFLINLFYTTYIDPNNYIDIHPIIFNYNMYKQFVKEIGNNTKDGIRIIIGESFNKLGLLVDLYYKSDSYYLPFSKHIYSNNKFAINKKYKKYLTKEYLSTFKYIIIKLIPYDIMKGANNIYIYDLIESGKGLFSFIHIFNIIFPEFKDKIYLILISNFINDKYKLYYSSNNNIEIKKKLKRDNIRHRVINFKCNIYILNIFTEERYNNRCFKSLPIEKINNKKLNIFEEYSDINRNNLIKFFINFKLESS